MNKSNDEAAGSSIALQLLNVEQKYISKKRN